jgi:nucleotide-binding universal stress UspA family protein
MSASRSTILGSVSSRVTQDARHPVLVVRPGPHSEPVWGPVFVCYDGSDAAGYAIATAGKQLARRDAILAYFLPAVDDGVVLQSTLPWPVSSAVQDRLAALDREEAGRPVRVAAHGVEIARRAGLEARSLAVGEEGLAVDHEAVAWVRLTEAAAAESASCIVVGHRRSARGISRLDSTAYGLVNHADRPVLVVPAT